MSDTVSRGPALATSNDDRILATLLYALLFLTPFFMGLPALLAVVAAYVRRPQAADAFARSHYGFQIKIFWIAVAILALAAAAAFLGAGVLITHFLDMSLRGGSGWDAWDVSIADAPEVHVNLAALVILAVSALAILGDLIWLMLAAVFGVARLLSGEPIGRLKAA
jgi:uncharacterized membrane protein